jgi:hypothetical protein
MPMRIALVSCVKQKRPVPAPARDLYDSALFRGMRRFAERNTDRWFILSAQYGLVAPGIVIARYDRTLNRMSARERKEWAGGVLAALDQEISDGDTVVMLAGVRYREHIIPALEARRISVEVPLKHLGLGRQLQWLRRQNVDA